MSASRCARAALVLVLVWVVLGCPAGAHAGSALIEHLGIFGEIDEHAARAHLERTLERAGYRPIQADQAGLECWPGCTPAAMRAAGATVVVEATYLGLAEELSLAIRIRDLERGAEWRVMVARLSLDDHGVSDDLARVLRAPESALDADAHQSQRRVPAWALLAGSAVLLAGGSTAIWHAYAQRREFYERFVDPSGAIVGISPSAARAREQRANRWLLAGILASSAGVLAGAGSAVLFFSGDNGRSAGIVVTGHF